MHVDIAFAQLHNALFLAGSNLGDKLDPAKRTGLKLLFDVDKDRLFVIYNGKCAIVPASNVSSAQPKNAADIGIDIQTPHIAPVPRVITTGSPMVANVSQTAQVETPHSQVQNRPNPPRKHQ